MVCNERTVPIDSHNTGKLGTNTVEYLQDIVSQVPMVVLEPSEATEPFSSLIWIRQAVRALDHAGIISCPDALALEREMLKLAVDNDMATGLGEPYMVHVATKSS